MMDNIDDETRIKLYMVTTNEYLKFSEYFNRLSEKDKDNYSPYIASHTKIMLLRKYFSNKEPLYLERVLISAIALYPQNKSRFNAILTEFHKIQDDKREIILSDGTVQDLITTILDITYGLDLHSDETRIKRLLTTDQDFFTAIALEYADKFEKIVITLHDELSRYSNAEFQLHNPQKAAVIFSGTDKAEGQNIASAPYWSNIRGRDANQSDLEDMMSNLAPTDLHILKLGIQFIDELQKENYSVKTLQQYIFPPTKDDWGNFCHVHELVKGVSIGYSTTIRYNSDKSMAYLSLFKNVPEDGSFIVNQAHESIDIIILTFVNENKKYGWRIFCIGDKLDQYKMTGSIRDWFKYQSSTRKK